ncbi:MAG: hypothetical protein AB7P02_19500, partial [Alphaproteobacteria bacterium]
MLLAAGVIVLFAGAILAWLAWRRLPRPWGRWLAIVVATPSAVVAGLLVAGVLGGQIGCAEHELWRRPTPDGTFDTAATSIACAGGLVTYNV